MFFTTIKILHTLFVLFLVPVYWYHYGPQNFLWFSDLALILSIVALWRESSLLASTQAVSVLMFEIIWSIDFLGGLFIGEALLGMSSYMFDPKYRLWLRMLSLFHLWLPWLLLWMVVRFGYDRRALSIQMLVCWIVLVASYFISTPEENINWVFKLGSQPPPVPRPVYLAIMMIAIPTLVYLPTHLVLMRFARK
jgi:hypothetical protein